MRKRMLVLGANSDIAKAIVRLFAKKGFDFVLCARNPERLIHFKSELENASGSKISLEKFDALNYASHQAFVNKIHPVPQFVLCAFGYLGEQSVAEENFHEAQKITDTNYTGAVSIINALIPSLEKNATIIGISSVAGDRGRQSNYFYGSAKAALSAYLNGLRNKLFKKGIHVVLVKPGFVDTRMTQGREIPQLLLASPETVAGDIYKGYLRKRNIVYTPWYWKWVMLVIKAIPEPLFKRLSL